MSGLIQLAYISKASFADTQASGGVVNEISKILQKSRRNNRARNVVGALYYGNGSFFQCLEGEEDSLMNLYKTIEADPRHSDVQIVYKKEIAARTFEQWEMKYLPRDQDVQSLIGKFGMKTFDPFAFNEAQTAQMVQLLASASPEEPKSVTHNNRPVKSVERAIIAKTAKTAAPKPWPLIIFVAVAVIAALAAVKFLA